MKTAQDIILKPLVSEKSYDGMKNKVYQFKVAKDANKDQIKRAIELLFKVRVEKVNTIVSLGREKRRGVFRGMTPSTKKAIVTLNKEDSIAFFEGIA